MTRFVKFRVLAKPSDFAVSNQKALSHANCRKALAAAATAVLAGLAF